MSIVIRTCARLLLLHDNKVLLMKIGDLDIGPVGGVKRETFWCTIGGGMEEGETIEHAALREVYEETGIAKELVELGPLVWCTEIDLIWKEQATRFKEYYVVAKTAQKEVTLHALTDDEKAVVKELRWFSLQDIIDCKDPIFPEFLPEYLPAILAGDYPKEMLEFDLNI
ncbi:MAG TPA: NUDIX domain-containing protein [Candidatus Babeliales bacterium]|nr:NUDIX domain-containing protein [Candidatus Babeliales bacterium]